MSLLKLPLVECRGDARALGNQQGEALRERINAFIEQRLAAFAQYSQERGGPNVEHWNLPGVKHTAAVREAAKPYEARITAFFDRALR